MIGTTMGNQLSRQQSARRWSSLREELTFPDPSWEFYDGWEIYHIDIELQTLPPHVRDKILDICVDEYTQEIIACEEGECTQKTHRCCKSQPCPQKQGSSDTGRRQDCASSLDEACCQQDVDKCQGMCMQHAGSPPGMGTYDHHKTELDDLILQWKLSLREWSDSEICSQTNDEQSRSHNDVSSNRVCTDDTRQSQEACVSTSALVNTELQSTAQKAQSPSAGCKMNEGLSSSKVSSGHFKSVHRRCLSATESIDFSALGQNTVLGCHSNNRDQWSKSNARSIPTNKHTTRSSGVINSSQNKLMASPGDLDDMYPFTKASSLPSRRQSVPVAGTHELYSLPNSPACRKRRKFSLKEEPGWIPNPLDSDSDQEQSEDSGVFSDYAASPKQAPDLCAQFLAHKTVARLKERRRCNSEPSATRSAKSSLSESCFDNRPDTKSAKLSSILGARRHSTSDSKWSLVKSPWRRSKSKLLDDIKLSVPVEIEEADLEKELRWLVTDPECQELWNEERPEEDFPTDGDQKRECSSENCSDLTHSSYTDSALVTAGPRQTQPSGALQQELELDWLCEPEWNNLELEMFWNVLRPHLEFLLQHSETDHLPDPRVVVACMDSADQKMLDSCLLHVQRHIWKGNYRQAVADFRAIKRHFRCCANSRLIQCGIQQDDVESLRLVFLRKRPSRYRLWI